MADSTGTKTTSETTGRLPVGALGIPGRNGGRLRNGGTNKGGPGRPPSALRAGLREGIPAELKRLEKHARAIDKLGDPEKSFKAHRELAEFRAKYGLGTTSTQTDGQGADAPPPGTTTVNVIVTRNIVRGPNDTDDGRHDRN